MSTFDQLKTWPWITLLLLKLALEDQMILFKVGKSCPREIFDRCRQELWDADDRDEDNKGNVYLKLRSLVQVQLLFQTKIAWEFLRWPALISRLPIDHPTRQQFIDRFEIEPHEFLCLCYAAYVPVLNQELVFNQVYFEPLRAHFGESVNRFFQEFSRDLPGLRAELRRELANRITAGKPARPRHELVELPWLLRYPLLISPERLFIVWHPVVFARGMEQGVHRRLSELKGEYSSHFSKVFENYVLQLITEAGLAYLNEKAYKQAIAADRNTVEAIVTIGDTNVFIESKLTTYSDDLLISDRAPVVWTNLKRIREAMHQGWMVSSMLRSGNAPVWPCTSAQEDFLIIVTSQPGNIATGEHFRRLFKQDIFDPQRLRSGPSSTPTVRQLEQLPLTNILILSIEEFEHLIGCVLNGEIELVPFLQEAAKANADPTTAVMFVDQLLGQKTKQWRLPNVLAEARDEAELLFERILPP